LNSEKAKKIAPGAEKWLCFGAPGAESGLVIGVPRVEIGSDTYLILIEVEDCSQGLEFVVLSKILSGGQGEEESCDGSVFLYDRSIALKTCPVILSKSMFMVMSQLFAFIVRCFPVTCSTATLIHHKLFENINSLACDFNRKWPLMAADRSMGILRRTGLAGVFPSQFIRR
jgi:hypothetical protein